MSIYRVILYIMNTARRHMLGRIDRLARWLLAAVFAAAAVPKLLAPADFAAIIAMYGLVPNDLLPLVAVLLPLVELAAAIGLLFRCRWALPLTAFLLVLFIGVLLYGLHLGLAVDCGCFGPQDPEHGALASLKSALVRDIVLCIPVVFSWWYNRIETIEEIVTNQKVKGEWT